MTYTARDPKFEMWCTACRFGDHDECVEDIVIESGVMAGKYRCACLHPRRGK